VNSHDYRNWRQRRRAAWTEIDRNRIHPDTEAEFLIEFASKWAAYGGATKEEIFLQFGMTKNRFVDRLWRLIPESKCGQKEISDLANAYPHHRWTTALPPV